MDPDDPWSHPDAERLDRLSVADWLRERGGTRNVVRARDLAMLALSAESIERTSLLAELRKEAAAGGNGFYDYEVWECSRVAEGSATVALRMAEELGHRVRYGTPVKRIRVSPERVHGHDRDRRAVRLPRPWCARVPVGPLRRHPRRGRLATSACARSTASATRSPPRSCFTYADSFWHEQGQNGDVYFETGVIGGTWPQREGIMSALVPPERLAAFLTTSPAQLEGSSSRDGRGVRRASRATRRRSSSAAGASTRSRSATSPAGGPAT